MADAKISALPAASTPLAGTEILPIVQSGSTVKVANNDLRPKQVQSNATSGVVQFVGPAAASTRVITVPDANSTMARTDAAQSFTGDQTLSTGNVIQGTAAKGYNFTANTPASGMTSQLFNWYEEGTWTPVVTAASGAITSYTSSGTYTRIGRMVYLQCTVTITNNGTGASWIYISGVPFSLTSSLIMISRNNSLVNVPVYGTYFDATKMDVALADGTYPAATNAIIRLNGNYSI